MDLRSLPKVELHRHLEGSIRLATILDLYRDAGAPLPERTPEELAPRTQILEPVRGLAQALERFAVAQHAVRTYEAVRRITVEAVEDLAADGVRLAELRFSPEFLCAPAGLDWDGALDAILEGLEEARDHDVAVGLICIASRDYGLASAERTVAFALRHRDHVVGFDLAGPEARYPPHMFAGALAPLREAGMPLTAHYGEAAGPGYPREAIEELGVRRLGHGVSVAQDPTVTALALERGVALEMCPTSNARTGAVPSLRDHPALRLLREGVGVTINTDDPGLFGIDLSGELEVARDVLGFTDGDLRRATGNALAASFLPEDAVEAVRARHFSWVEGAGPSHRPRADRPAPRPGRGAAGAPRDAGPRL